MSPLQRIYLDNAATSWPKPDGVLDAIVRFYREQGGAAGRGAHSSSHQSDALVTACRTALRELVKAQVDDQVVFAYNGTDALNLAIHGIVRPGDHVLVNVLEHNSVLRPVAFLAEHRGVAVTFLKANSLGQIDPQQVREALRPNTRLVCCTHASNVSGVIQPVASIGAICQEAGAFFLVDAAQTAGRVPIDVRELRCDFLAAAGHKGLLGPLGTAFLYLSARAAREVLPLRQGGTGTESHSEHQPIAFPARLETGNLNVGGIAGLLAGLRHLETVGLDAIARHEQQMLDILLSQLDDCQGVEVVGRSAASRVAIASLVLAEHDVHDSAAILDSAFGIQVRAGLHCAPHAVCGSIVAEPVPTLRISPGWRTTRDEMERAATAIREIVG